MRYVCFELPQYCRPLHPHMSIVTGSFNSLNLLSAFQNVYPARVLFFFFVVDWEEIPVICWSLMLGSLSPGIDSFGRDAANEK